MRQHYLIDIHIPMRCLKRLGASAHCALHLRVETDILERLALEAKCAEFAVDLCQLLFVGLLPLQ